jgi:predicted ribosomally synthesized peptide with nif11-like leader
MSVENLKEYGKKVAHDPDLLAKAQEVGLENIEGQMVLAKSLNLEFSMDDMEALGREVSSEMTEDQLELVAGGVVTTTGLAVVGAAAAVVAAGAAVTLTTQGKGW